MLLMLNKLIGRQASLLTSTATLIKGEERDINIKVERVAYEFCYTARALQH